MVTVKIFASTMLTHGGAKISTSHTLALGTANR